MIEDGIRVDSGVKANWKVSPAYDPMVAKVIAHGESGDESRLTLIEALRQAASVCVIRRGSWSSSISYPPKGTRSSQGRSSAGGVRFSMNIRQKD